MGGARAGGHCRHRAADGSSPQATETESRLRGELLWLGVDVQLAERRATREPRAADSRAWVERMSSRNRHADALIDIIDGNSDIAGAAGADRYIFGGRRTTIRPM